ncbi:hypothetical protein JMJ35_009813 [Cladonia borealis]|uniref:Large ribosomal subunit protein uL10-like insertion domain-containing protein n=1 Tax=Cladonia borealis TaxID=184061 RepID=A0AA39QT54_9LECA|nr:hypothetical protein JMJ35_009813 [Cladonia borealis]
MPKSKRAKIVHTSKTQKKRQRTNPPPLRQHPRMHPPLPLHLRLQHSRLFFGKTKVMSHALGHTPSTTPSPSLHLLTPHLHGPTGLLFSSSPPPEILSYFTTYTPLDYARAGTRASRDFVIPRGVVSSRGGEIPVEEDVAMAMSVEPNLRRLGVPVRLMKGRVLLDTDEGWTVCRKGEVLGSGQSSLLKMFGVQMAEFRVRVVAWYERETGEVRVVEGEEQGEGGVSVDGDGDEDEEMGVAEGDVEEETEIET